MSAKNTPITDKPSVIVDQVLTKKAALLVLSGKDSVLALSKELGLSRWATKKMVDSQEFKDLITTLSETELLPLIQEMRKNVANLGKKAIKVLELHLNEGNLEAVKIVFKSMGLAETEMKQSDTNLTVVLPSGLDGSVKGLKDIEI